MYMGSFSSNENNWTADTTKMIFPENFWKFISIKVSTLIWQPIAGANQLLSFAIKSQNNLNFPMSTWALITNEVKSMDQFGQVS